MGNSKKFYLEVFNIFRYVHTFNSLFKNECKEKREENNITLFTKIAEIFRLTAYIKLLAAR